MRLVGKPRAIGGVNITSLCDVMLSLLIFFMLVTKSGVDTGVDEDIELPLATLGITEEDLQRERELGLQLVLNLDPESPRLENPRVYGRLYGSGEAFSLNVVSGDGRPELTPFIRRVKGDRTDFVVAIHASAGTPFATIEPVLRSVNAAEPARVQYAFTRPRDQR